MSLCADIAISGRPFSLFDSEPMRKIIGYALKGSDQSGDTGVISGQKVRAAVSERAQQMRKQIAEIIQTKQVSISSDFASLHGNDFLGECAKNDR